MPYSDKVLDHAENPRNAGSLDKDAPDVGTAIVGAPACGDVMKLQIRVKAKIVGTRCTTCHGETRLTEGAVPMDFFLPCGHESFRLIYVDVIDNAKFKTFGCGSAIASSSLATEWLKGKTLDEAATLSNVTIVEELSLPPVKIHCSVLTEDAVKSAVANYRAKSRDRSPPNTDTYRMPLHRSVHGAAPPYKHEQMTMVPLPAEFPAAVGCEDPSPDPPSPPPPDPPKEVSVTVVALSHLYGPFNNDGY